MSFEMKDNSGSLFKNENKKEDTHPDYKGNCMVNGKRMEFAAWKKKDKNGNGFLSFKFSEPWKPKEGWRKKQTGDDLDLGEENPF